MGSEKLKQLPQNLKALLQDIGENAALFCIFTKIHQTEWKAFKNLDEAGCDIVLMNLKTSKLLKIEVKTRQSIYSSAKKKNHNSKLFQMTKLEYNSMDFLICYWFDNNNFFLVPKGDIDGKKKSIRIRIVKGKNDLYGVNEKYRNNWDVLVKAL
jgi:hypothetical protein